MTAEAASAERLDASASANRTADATRACDHSTTARGLGVMVAGTAIEWLCATWDIATHGDVGPNGLLTAPHLGILTGLGLVIAGSLLSVVRARRCALTSRTCEARPAVVVLIAAVIQLIGFGVDNLWHAMFGIDISLWSPPHLLILVPGWMAGIGLMAAGARWWKGRFVVTTVWIGYLLATLTVLLAEFELGFPHFDVTWYAAIEALVFGLLVGLVNRLTTARLSVTSAAVSLLVFRLVELGFNQLVGRSLALPEVGLLGGALVVDGLARLPQVRLILRVIPGWAVVFLITSSYQHRYGKFWFPTATLAPAFVKGCAFVIAGAVAGRWFANTVARQPAPAITGRTMRPFALAAVMVIGFSCAVGARTGTASTPTPRAVQVTFGPHNAVEARLSASHRSDFISVFDLAPPPSRGSRWIGGLTWARAGTFVGHLKTTPDFPYFWYSAGETPWRQLGPPVNGDVVEVRLLPLDSLSARRVDGRLVAGAYSFVFLLLMMSMVVVNLVLRGDGDSPDQRTTAGAVPTGARWT